MGKARISAYRWHIDDAMPFAQSIRVTIQQWDRTARGGGGALTSDYSSVAYWYQQEPHALFPPLPPPEGLLP
jgi:hypothetical protein